MVWSGTGDEGELLRVSNGFHIKEDRLPGKRNVVACNVCGEVEPPGVLSK
jgi:hypothetical protein